MIDKKYLDFLKEHAINRKKIEINDNILKNINDVKKISKYLNSIILELREYILNIKILYYRKYDENKKNDYLIFRFDGNIGNLIDNLRNILNESDKSDNGIYDKYFNIIYPDGKKLPFDIEVDIERNNLNRIHVPVGLPYILKSIGLGKKIYKLLIKDYTYISTTGLDISMDYLFVWDNLIDDNTIYSFIRNKKIICISPNVEFEKMKTIIMEFYKNIDDEYIILDDDFKNKYKKLLLKSDLKEILKYEIKQHIDL